MSDTIGARRRNLSKSDSYALDVLLGDNLLPLLLLALGAAMAVGNGLALVRPPAEAGDGDDLPRAPLARSLTFIAVGLVVAGWAVASLVAG